MKKKCKIVMIPSEIWTEIGFIHEINKIQLFTGREDVHNTASELAMSQNIFILSDEEIKEGDNVIFNNKVITLTKDDVSPAMQERQRGVIIGTTDHSFALIPDIPKDIVHAYIKAYNEGNPVNQVEVEAISTVYEAISTVYKPRSIGPSSSFISEKELKNMFFSRDKLNQDGTLAVSLIEEEGIKGKKGILDGKMYTQTELDQHLHEAVHQSHCSPTDRIKSPHSNSCAEFVNKWIKDNL